MNQKRIPYLENLRNPSWKSKAQDSKDIAPTFCGPKPEGDVLQRLEFAEKCLEHERIQLKKTVAVLRQVEHERDELLAIVAGLRK
jgi:hypothetical protein